MVRLGNSKWQQAPKSTPGLSKNAGTGLLQATQGKLPTQRQGLCCWGSFHRTPCHGDIIGGLGG